MSPALSHRKYSTVWHLSFLIVSMVVVACCWLSTFTQASSSYFDSIVLLGNDPTPPPPVCAIDRHVNCTATDDNRQPICTVYQCSGLGLLESIEVRYNVTGQGSQMFVLSQQQYETLLSKVQQLSIADPLPLLEDYNTYLLRTYIPKRDSLGRFYNPKTDQVFVILINYKGVKTSDVLLQMTIGQVANSRFPDLTWLFIVFSVVFYLGLFVLCIGGCFCVYKLGQRNSYSRV